MTEIIFSYLLALLAGLVLGLFYFGILWITVQQIPTTKKPFILIMGSFLVRMTFLFGAFYLIVSYSDWQYLIACLIGFMLTRFVMVRKIKSTPNYLRKAEVTEHGHKS